MNGNEADGRGPARWQVEGHRGSCKERVLLDV